MAKRIDDIVSLDPAEAYEFSDEEAIANLYDRLLDYDPAHPADIRGRSGCSRGASMRDGLQLYASGCVRTRASPRRPGDGRGRGLLAAARRPLGR